MRKNLDTIAIARLNRELSYLDLDDLCIHTGPIIHKEEIYTNMTVEERRRIFNKMVAFFRKINIRYKCFYIEKKHFSDYKLFQVADLLCSMELIKLKIENNIFSKSEKNFFGSMRDLKKNYLKPISKKEWW